jgi:hypothetical protein
MVCERLHLYISGDNRLTTCYIGNRNGMVLFNDARFLAHQLLSLGHQFSSVIPNYEKQNNVVFLEQVPLLYEFGKSRLQTELVFCYSPRMGIGILCTLL